MKTLKTRCNSAGAGLTILELLCAIALIAILLGLIGGAVAMSRSKAEKLKKDIGEGQASIIEMQEPGGLLSSD